MATSPIHQISRHDCMCSQGFNLSKQRQQILTINACPRNSFWWYSSPLLVHVAHLTFISDSFVSAVSSSIHFLVCPAHILARVMIIFLTQSTSLSSSHYLMSLRTNFTWLIKNLTPHTSPSPCAPSTKSEIEQSKVTSSFVRKPSTISHRTKLERIRAHTTPRRPSIK